MGLPARQRRTLELMERRLHAREPKLVLMFSMFARLTQDEVLPSIEAIRHKRWHRLTGNRRLGAAFVPFVVVLLATTALVVGGLLAPRGQCANAGSRYSAIKTGFVTNYCSPRLVKPPRHHSP